MITALYLTYRMCNRKISDLILTFFSREWAIFGINTVADFRPNAAAASKLSVGNIQNIRFLIVRKYDRQMPSASPLIPLMHVVALVAVRMLIFSGTPNRAQWEVCALRLVQL